LEPKFVKKMPLFGKIFIHPPSHSGIFDGPGQISMALPVKEASGFGVLEYWSDGKNQRPNFNMN
jgi:hypothetical protein